jgi:D-alanyl-D-alanine carboxypeptidase (penicillin-binding protein 5/6)
MLGIKTGHTNAAGWCLAFAARRADHYLIGVILGSSSEGQRDQDVEQLLDWAFALPLLPP